MRFLMTLLRVGMAIAIVNGAVRTANVYWSYYQFEDAAQQLVLFGSRTPTEELHSSAIEKAGELEIPIEDDQISVTREGAKTSISASYEHPVEYFPNQLYPLKLSFNVEGRNVTSSAQ